LAVKERIRLGTLVETRTYWIDPSRDHVIVRMLYSVNDVPRSQLDIRYDLPSGEAAWVPCQWSGLQFGLDAQVSHLATAVRTGFQRKAIPASVFQAELPVGSRRVFPDWEQTPHRTLHLEEGPEIEQRWKLESRWLLSGRSLLKFAAWPWIIVTLVSSWGALILVHRALSSRHGTRSSISSTVLRRQLLGIILASLIAFLFRDAAISHPSLQEIHQELADTWTLGRELRQQYPTEIKWNAYCEEAEKRVQNLLVELAIADRRLQADQATSRQQWNEVEARKALFTVAREHLPAMLRDRQQMTVSQEAQLAQCLNDAKELLSKDSLVEAGQQRNGAHNSSGSGQDGGMMTGVLIGNAIFVSYAFFRWVKGRPRLATER
jgi:hypothetical protein